MATKIYAACLELHTYKLAYFCSVLSVHLTSSKSLVGIVGVASEIQKEKKVFHSINSLPKATDITEWKKVVVAGNKWYTETHRSQCCIHIINWTIVETLFKFFFWYLICSLYEVNSLLMI